MPVIATSDTKLHTKLKIFVALHPELTIGKAVEKFVSFALESDLGELNEEDKRKAKEYIKNLSG